MSEATERFADDAHRYRLDSRIATGGMGEVWRATDTVLGREVAVKLLKREYADDAQFRSRFETEARHAAALHHPGVAGVYDFGEAAGDAADPHPKPFLVMELVDGRPLSALIGGDRELDPEAVRGLMIQAGDALAAAHAAGIVHRDVKPANLLVTPDRRVKITDFGIARAGDGVGITQTGAVMGTPQYLSPEQARGERATPASDVYSLGVVAFECLAGHRPFDADSPVATALAHLHEPVPDLPADVPGDLAAVVRRAMAKDPADRYADAGAFAEALRDPASAVAAAPPPRADDGLSATQVLPTMGVGAAGAAGVGAAAAYPPPEETSRRGRRNLVGLWVLLAVLLIAGIVIVVFALAGGDDEGEPPPVQESPRQSRTTERSEPTTRAPTTPTEQTTPTSEPPPTSTAPTTEPTTSPPTTATSEPPPPATTEPSLPTAPTQTDTATEPQADGPPGTEGESP